MDYAGVRYKARLLLEDLKPSYPLDVRWFTSVILGKPVEIVEIDDMDHNFSAVITDKSYYEKAYIIVNKKHPVFRQRFSIMHEMGHIYLEHVDDGIDIIDEGEDEVLKEEADIFATEVLMPKKMVAEYVYSDMSDLDIIYRMRMEMRVSYEAACRRIVELGLTNSAYLLLESMENVCFIHKSEFFHMDDWIIEKYLTPSIEKLYLGQEIKNTIMLGIGEILTMEMKKFYSGRVLLALKIIAAEKHTNTDVSTYN